MEYQTTVYYYLNQVNQYHCLFFPAIFVDASVFCRSTKRSAFMFLRVEVVLEGATFHVILADTDRLPPPFRIDNLSPVSSKSISFQSNSRRNK